MHKAKEAGESRVMRMGRKKLWMVTQVDEWMLRKGAEAEAEAEKERGNIAKVRIGLVDVKPGDYVLTHVGIAIEVMDEEKARGIFDVWAQIADSEV